MAQMTVLAVDDRPENLFVWQEVFAESLPDCTLRSTTSALEALELARRGRFDGALIDVQMPEMDGVELCRRLKADPATATIPIILITAHHSRPQLKAEGLEAGAEDFLAKPIDNIELLARIRVMLRMKTAEDALRHANAHLEEQVRERTQQLEEINQHLECLVEERSRALLASEKEYQRLFENLQDMCFRTDADHRLVLVSPSVSKIAQFAVEELLGQDVAVLFPEPGQRRDFLRQTAARGRVEGFESKLRRADGSEVWLSTNAQVRRDETGCIQGFDALSRDVTAIKRSETEKQVLQERLKEKQKLEAVGQLAGGVAHDFNNLLMVIQSSAEFIQADLPPDSPMAEDVEQIISGVGRGAELVNRLLSFSRRRSVKTESLDLGQVVRKTAATLGHLQEQGVVLELQVASDLWPVKADAGLIHELIANLAINAREAMPQGGTLAIEARNTLLNRQDAPRLVDSFAFAAGEFVLLSVADNGTGMSAEVKRRMFEPFFTTKGLANASGLGLSVVHGIVKQHGGVMALDSESGQGTCVRIYLPRYGGQSTQMPGGPALPGGSETIVVVEESEPLRYTVQRILQPLGYRVLVASDWSRVGALAQACQGTIDLVLGSDHTHEQRQARAVVEQWPRLLPGAWLLLMSEHRPSVMIAGSTQKMQWLQKPFSREELARKVRAVLDGPASRQTAQMLPDLESAP